MTLSLSSGNSFADPDEGNEREGLIWSIFDAIPENF
jgi:hypothetical protein